MSYKKTSPEISAMGDLAILPVGSLEQHSHHLPVCTDILIPQAYADKIGERMGAFVLPCLPISTCYEHKGTRGSVWMRADTFFTMLCDILLNLKDQGFTRIAVIKGHGGIFVMDPAIRHINSIHAPELRVCQWEPYSDTINHIFKTNNEIHSGEKETSLMLHLHPELVKMDRAVDFIPDVPRAFLQYGSVMRYSPDGVWGCPSFATKEKGRRYFEACLEEGIAYFEKIFSMMEGRAY